MPEENGFVTGDARVDEALKRMHERNDARFKSIEDALLVQVMLEKRMGELMKDQADYLASHETRLRSLDERVDKLVTSIGELIRRIPPENLR